MTLSNLWFWGRWIVLGVVVGIFLCLLFPNVFIISAFAWVFNDTGNMTVNDVPMVGIDFNNGTYMQMTWANFTNWTYWEPQLQVTPGGVLDINPGDIVYYGETVNLAPLLSDFTGSGTFYVDYWFYNHSPGAGAPDGIYPVPFARTRLIDRATFPYEGTYYQHMLPGEHVAIPVMEIREGIRLRNPIQEKARQENQTPPVVYDPYPPLPSRPSSYDYLVAKGDAINASIGENPAPFIWLFHQTDKEYFLQLPNNGTIPSDDTPAGRYDVILQWMGNNTLTGVFWDGTTNAIKTPCKSISLEDRLPFYVHAILMQQLENPACSDDPYEVKVLQVDEPYIEITNFDQFENASSPAYMVQGYTNLQPGETIKLIVDKDRWTHNDIRPHTTEALVYGDWGGEWRRFRAIVPVSFEEMNVGNHTLSAVSQYGTENFVSFYFNIIPNGTPPPETHLMYISNSPFIPQPTPITVEKEVVRREVVTEVKYVNVDPSVESCVNFSRDKGTAEAEKNIDFASTVIKGIGGIYGLSVVVRAWRRNGQK